MHFFTIASSFVVGALVLLQITGMNVFLSDQMHHASSERTSLEVAAGYAELLEHDLRRMGLGLEDPRGAIVAADSCSVSFWGNLDNDPFIERVSYVLGSEQTAADTSNPNDRVLFRVVDDEPITDVAMGVVGFELLFFNALGQPTQDWGTVRSVRYEIVVESPEPADDFDPVQSVTSGLVFPRNLTL